MNANDYIEMLSNYYVPFTHGKFEENSLLLHDNAPIHTARKTTTFLEECGIEALDWPPNSPDLNIIENIWGMMARKVYEGCKRYSTKEELIDAIYTAWDEIDQEAIENCIKSMPKRLLKVHATKGATINF